MDESRELRIEFTSNPGTIGMDFFPKLKSWIENAVRDYKGALVTRENLRAEKEDLAMLRKTMTNLENERKALKKAWQKPYLEWEASYTEAVAELTEAISALDTQIKDIERADKEERIHEIGDAIMADARDISIAVAEFVVLPSVWPRVFKAEYANSSYSRNKASVEWREALLAIHRDLTAIGEDKDLFNAYVDTGNLAEATLKAAEARKLRERIEGLKKKDEETVKAEIPEPEKKEEKIAYSYTMPDAVASEDAKKAIMTRVYVGPKYKLKALLEFADFLGLEVRKTN